MLKEEQVSLESGGARLYGMAYTPAGTPAGAVVFCHPLFEERKSAGRVMVDMARALCAGGFAVATFDYRGCGDSPGEFREFSVPDWLTDIGAALDFIKQRSPAAPVGLLGVRLGAALALQTAADRSDIAFAVLWEPAVNGRQYIEQELRKKLMKEMMTFGKGRQTRESLLKTLEQGGEVDFDGYPITAKLYRDLCGIDLTRAATTTKSRSLIVHVTSRDASSSPMAQLQNALQQSGSTSDLRLVNEPPFWNLIGIADCRSLIQETVNWIRCGRNHGNTSLIS